MVGERERERGGAVREKYREGEVDREGGRDMEGEREREREREREGRERVGGGGRK
jgi:hypothetical protein